MFNTQCDRLLQLFKERGAKGVFVYEMMTPRNQGGLGIAQYNTRISELRERGHNIVSDYAGHFVLNDDVVHAASSPTPERSVQDRVTELENTRAALQERLDRSESERTRKRLESEARLIDAQLKLLRHALQPTDEQAVFAALI